MSLLVVAVLVRCNWSIDLGVAYLPVLCASGPRRMILVTGLGGLPNASHTCTLLLLFHGRKWRKGRRRNPIPNRWRHVTFLWWKADVAMIFFPFLYPPEKKRKRYLTFLWGGWMRSASSWKGVFGFRVWRNSPCAAWMSNLSCFHESIKNF